MDAPAGAKVLRSAARKPPSKKEGKETENSAEKCIFALRNARRDADSAGEMDSIPFLITYLYEKDTASGLG